MSGNENDEPQVAPEAGQPASFADAQARLDALDQEMRDQGTAHPLLNKSDPRHREAVAEWSGLIEATAEGGGDEATAIADDVPAAPEDYNLNVDGLEDLGSSDEVAAGLDEVRVWLHAAGVGQGFAQAFAEDFAKAMADATRLDPGAMDRRANEAERTLKSAWGGQYDAKLAAAQRAVERIGGERMKAFLDNSGMGNDPALIRHLTATAERNGW